MKAPRGAQGLAQCPLLGSFSADICKGFKVAWEIGEGRRQLKDLVKHLSLVIFYFIKHLYYFLSFYLPLVCIDNICMLQTVQNENLLS